MKKKIYTKNFSDKKILKITFMRNFYLEFNGNF